MDSFIKRTFVNTYLDAPIIEGSAIDLCRLFCTPADALSDQDKRKHAQFVQLGFPLDYSVIIYNPRDLSELLSLVPEHNVETIQSIYQFAETLSETFFQDVLASLSSRWQHRLNHHSRVDSRLYFSLYSRAKFFEGFIDKLACSRATGARALIKWEAGNQILLGDQYSVAWILPSEKTVVSCPYEAILMFKDMLLSRANVVYTVGILYPDDGEIISLIQSIWKWSETCLARYGNGGYEVLKSLEAVCKTYCIQMHDTVFSDGDVLRRIANDMIAKENKLFDIESSTVKQADRLLDILHSASDVRQVIELFGLQKTTGHPMINPLVGGRSSAEEASAPKTTTYADAQRLRNNWARMYIEGFVRKTGRWPPLIFTPSGKSTLLFQLYGMRERNLTRHSYPLSDLEHVRFSKHANFDYHSNFLDLMDDKSLSHYLDEFRATWRRGIKLRSQRRLLLEMLSRPEVSIKTIIDTIESGLVPEEWLIVTLYPKEREFKLAPRMFSMMVFEMRAFFACIEDNIAEHIFPYLPQQTMTLTKFEIMEKFAEYTKPSTTPGVHKLFFEIDLTRWNLRWRDLPIRMIGNDLNDIFGLSRVYTFVHEFFERSMILVRIATYEPAGLDLHPPPASDLLWYNHQGGFEGITQKHWTIATYSMVDLGLHSFSLNYQIHGQADNQTIATVVTIPPTTDTHSYLKALTDRIKQSISDSCSRVGQEAKPEECIESTSVLTYSKNFYLNGVLVHLSLKAFSRVFPRSMSEIPTLYNNIASLGSACLAASEQLDTPLLGYRIMLFKLTLYLTEIRTEQKMETLALRPQVRKMIDARLIRRLLSTPSSLGGLPIPLPASFLYKGGSDQLSKDLSSLWMLPQSIHSYIAGIIHTLESGSLTAPEHRSESILTDPYSLPITTIPLVESRLQQSNIVKIKNVTQNRDISEIISAKMGEHKDDIIASLMKARPFNPQLLSDILSASGAGLQVQLTKMFATTRTIQALPSDGEDPGLIILQHGVTQFVKIILMLGRIQPTSCNNFWYGHQSAESLRKLWGRTKCADGSLGPVPEGLSNEAPFSWKMVIDDFRPSPCGAVTSVTSDSYIQNGLKQGANPMYLGTETREKRSQHGYKIVVSSSAERDVSNLLRISTQPGVSRSFKQVVDAIASARSPVSLLHLAQITSEGISGAISHRYASSMGLQTASVLGNHNITSFMSFHSDNAGPLSASTVDYPVMFQEFYVAAAGVATTVKHLGNHSGHLFLAFYVPESLTELPSNNIECSRPLAKPIPTHPHNRILYTSDIRLIRTSSPLGSAYVSKGSIQENVPPGLLFECLFSRAFRKGSVGASLADNVNTRSLYIRADLLEFRGAGIEAVISGASTAVARFSCNALFSRSSTIHRWQIVPLISTLSTRVARTIAHVFSHPTLRSLPGVSHFITPTAMTYGRYSVGRRIKSTICKDAYRLLTDGDYLSDRGAVLFDDDEPSSTIDALLTTIRMRLLSSCTRGEISRDVMMAFDREHILRLLSQKPDPERKVEALVNSCAILHFVALKNNLYGLQLGIETIQSGLSIKHYASGLDVELRKLRHVALTSDGEQATRQRAIDKDLQPAQELDEISNQGRVFDWTSLSSDRSSKNKDYLLFILKRRHSRLFDHYPAAAETFSRAKVLLVCNSAIIIGSGHGGAAAVIKHLGALRIIVHDLQKDVDPTIWGSLESGLPAVDAMHPRSCILERSYAGYSQCGGTCEEESTWREFRVLAPSDVMLVLDIAISTHDQWDRIISLSQRFFGGQPLITRWMVPEGELGGLGSILGPRLQKITALIVDKNNGWCEIVVRGIIRKHSSGSVAVNFAAAEESLIPTDFFARLSPNDLYQADFGDLEMAASCRSLANISGMEFSDSTLRNLRSFSSTEWTRVLRFLTVKELRSMSLDDALIWITNVVCGDQEWRVSGGVKPVAVLPSLSNLSFLKTEAIRYI